MMRPPNAVRASETIITGGHSRDNLPSTSPLGGQFIWPADPTGVPHYSRPRDLLAEWIAPLDALAYADSQDVLLPHRLPRALDRDLQYRYGDRV